MRKVLTTILKLVVTLLVFGVIVHRFGWESILQNLHRAQPGWLVTALVTFIVSVLLGVVQWHLLLESRKVSVSLKRATSLYFIGMFFNHFIFGAAAGDAVRVAFLKYGDNHSGKSGIAATFLDRFAGLWAMMGFAIAGSAILLWRGFVSGRTLTTAVIALFVTFVLFTGIQAFLVSRRLQSLFYRLLDRVPIPKKEIIRTISSQMLLESKDRGLVLRVALLSAIVQFLRIGVHVLCGAALGLLSGANFQYFFIFVPVLAILLMIPLPFGVREGIEGALFGLAGFSPDAAMVMAFLASIIGIAASFPGALLFILSKAELRQVMPHENLTGDTGL